MALPVAALEADDAGNSEIIQKYVANTESQQSVLRGLRMDIDIDASLPKLQKAGKLHALRKISRLGQITYQGLKFMGDNTIKTDVIARYLRAESETQNVSQMAITPTNYKFKYKGTVENNGRVMYIYSVSPRKKMVGLFKGEIWIDRDTYLPMREAGRFVKSPSIFLKKLEFVRDYEIKDGVAFPKHIESTVDTRFWGKAEMNIQFSNYTKDEEHAAAAATEAAESQ